MLSIFTLRILYNAKQVKESAYTSKWCSFARNHDPLFFACKNVLLEYNMGVFRFFFFCFEQEQRNVNINKSAKKKNIREHDGSTYTSLVVYTNWVCRIIRS